MLGYMLTTLAYTNEVDWKLRSAGTHVIEGSAMSSRTRDALWSIDELGVITTVGTAVTNWTKRTSNGRASSWAPKRIT